jgi:hypothetical protein
MHRYGWGHAGRLSMFYKQTFAAGHACAVWQAVLAYRRRQERLRSTRRSQPSRRHRPNTQPHRQRAGSGMKTPTKPSRTAGEQPASRSPPLAASKRGQAEVDMHSATFADTAQGSAEEAVAAASATAARQQRRRAGKGGTPPASPPAPAATTVTLEASEPAVEFVSGPLHLAEESATPCAAVFDKPPVELGMLAAPAAPAALAPETSTTASALQDAPSSTSTGAAGSNTEAAGHELGDPPALQQPADLLPSAADVLAAMLPFEIAGVLPSQQQQQHQQAGTPPSQQQQATPGTATAGPGLAQAITWEEQPLSALQPEAMQESGDAGGSYGSRSAPGTPAASKAPYAAVTPVPAAPIWPYSPRMHSAAATAAAAKKAVSAAAPSAGGAATGEASECIVCWEAERAVVLVPCGHLGLCRSCADDLLSEAEPLCPLCRAEVLFAQAFYSA